MIAGGILARRAQNEGFATHLVLSGAEALEALREDAFSLRPWDAMLLDCDLGDMSGFDLLSTIRSHFPWTSKMRVVLVSSAASATHPHSPDARQLMRARPRLLPAGNELSCSWDECAALGVEDFWQKPVCAEMLQRLRANMGMG